MNDGAFTGEAYAATHNVERYSSSKRMMSSKIVVRPVRRGDVLQMLSQ